jgi:hypothetical protein
MYQIANVTFVQCGDLLDLGLTLREPPSDGGWNRSCAENPDDQAEGRARYVRSDRFPRRKKPRKPTPG